MKRCWRSAVPIPTTGCILPSLPPPPFLPSSRLGCLLRSAPVWPLSAMNDIYKAAVRPQQWPQNVFQNSVFKWVLFFKEKFRFGPLSHHTQMLCLLYHTVWSFQSNVHLCRHRKYLVWQMACRNHCEVAKCAGTLPCVIRLWLLIRFCAVLPQVFKIWY